MPIRRMIPLNIYDAGDAEKRFRTYLNYLKQFDAYIETNVGKGDKLVKHLWSQTQTIQGTKSYDETFLEKSLNLAWNSETVACCFGLEEPEALRINNHWKPIQVYYAIYSCTEALCHLLAPTKTRFTHKGALKEVSQLFTRMKILPWGFAYDGIIGKDGKSHSPLNFPTTMVLDNNLKRDASAPENMLATCLRAEHKNRISDSFEERKGKQKKGEPKLVKYKINPGCTTFLHFAYRLRIRSNYHSAAMYHANVRNNDVIDFDKYMNKFCRRTLCVMELMVIRKIGKEKFLSVYEKFNAKVECNHQLEKRINFYKALK